MPGLAPPRRPQRLAGLNNGRSGAVKPISRTNQRDSACGCSNPEFDFIDGAKICLNCGTQVSENNIVAEVTFGETANGAAAVEGGRVGDDQRFHNGLAGVANRAMGGHGSGRAGGDHEQNGREACRTFTGRIPMSQATVDQAIHLYRLAGNEGFTKGRRAEEVAGACLYAVCRRDSQNTVLLMDLAEIISVNVFSLGDTYKELTKVLFMDVKGQAKLIEIEPLVLKYAAKLEFGDKTRQVAEDAVKIIRRMKRDWIVTGRHPAGLCGACIILAARMNNFRRTVREVVFVVKVADLTISKRLEEFKRTRSSYLTVDEFRSVGNRIKLQHDPPSIYEQKERARKLLERKRKRLEWEQSKENPIEIADDNSNAPSRQSSMAPSPAPEQQPEQPATEPQDPVLPPTKKTKVTRKRPNTAAPAPKEPRRDADGFVIPEPPIDPLLLAAANAAAEEIANEDFSEQTNNNERSAPDQAMKTKRKAGRPRKDKKEKEELPEPSALTEAELIAEEELQDEIEHFLRDDDCVSKTKDELEREKMEERTKALAAQQKALTAAAVAQRAQNQGRTHYVIPDSEIIGEDEFADDPEVQNALLTEEQVKVKEMIWVAHNEDWLRSQQSKQLKRAMDEAEGRHKERTKRRKRGRMGDGTVLEGGTPVESPADASRRMIEKRAPKQFSQRVNYAALGAIYNTRGTPGPGEGSEAGTPAPSSRAGSVVPSDVGGDMLPTPPATQAQPAVSKEGSKPHDEDEEDEDDEEDYWPDADKVGQQKPPEPEEDEEEVAQDFGVSLGAGVPGEYGLDEDNYSEPEYEDEYASDVGGDDQGFESP